jgi:hypothetical protein
MTPKEFLKEYATEIELRAKNNYGDWYDENSEIMLENARAKVKIAIEEILAEEFNALKEELFSIVDTVKDERINEIVKEMLE